MNTPSDVYVFFLQKDVNECTESLHDCNSNAVCANGHGTYSCSCNKGNFHFAHEICTKTSPACNTSVNVNH